MGVGREEGEKGEDEWGKKEDEMGMGDGRGCEGEERWTDGRTHEWIDRGRGGSGRDLVSQKSLARNGNEGRNREDQVRLTQRSAFD